MGKGRIWSSEEKAKIVVQGLKGRAVSEICNEYRIHQTQYYKWREQFLENISKVFETKAQSKKEERLERENQKLKTMVGEMAMELKKKRLVKYRRKRSTVIEESDRAVLPIIRQLKAEHPFWGYRRTWAYLVFVERLKINKKRVYRLLRENDLLVKGDEKIKSG